MSQRKHRRTLAYYWPHVGIALGVCLNAAGLVTGQSDLIATGSNIMALCSFKLAQRSRKRDEDGGS